MRQGRLSLTSVLVPALPIGSTQIAQWAQRARLGYEAFPDEAWFRRWEPHDAIAPPARFVNACTWLAQPDPGHIVIVEPWYAADEDDPLSRVVMAFAVHPMLRHRAAMRAGDHFVTRVAYIESAPPPTVLIGDPLWDENVTTLARSESEAAGGFHRRVGCPKWPPDSMPLEGT